MVRLKTRWNQKDRPRRFGETGGAVAVSLWKLAAASVLNLENEGFETSTNSQRLDVIGEFLACSIHLVDRLAYTTGLHEEKRRRLVSAVAARSIEIMCENREGVGDEYDVEKKMIGLINQRSDEYADCNFDAVEGPSFTMRRILGGHIQCLMGEKDSKWIPDYVIAAEAPEIFKGLKRTVQALLKPRH